MQSHGQRMRWLCGEYEAHASADVTISQRQWLMVGRRGRTLALLRCTLLPELPLQQGVTFNAELKQQASPLLCLCCDNTIEITLNCCIHAFIDFPCLKISHDFRHVKIRYIRRICQ